MKKFLIIFFFLFLPAISHAETIYSSAGDGYVKNTDAVWATAHDASNSNELDYVGSSFNLAAGNNGSIYIISRGLFPFDTSILDTDATIESAQLCFTVSALLGSDDYALVSTTQANYDSIASGDYDSFGSTELASRLTISDTIEYCYELNASGISNINVDGYSYFGVLNEYDIDNTAPTGPTVPYITIYSSENSGTTNDPHLTITLATATTSTTTTDIFITSLVSANVIAFWIIFTSSLIVFFHVVLIIITMFSV